MKYFISDKGLEAFDWTPYKLFRYLCPGADKWLRMDSNDRKNFESMLSVDNLVFKLPGIPHMYDKVCDAGYPEKSHALWLMKDLSLGLKLEDTFPIVVRIEPGDSYMSPVLWCIHAPLHVLCTMERKLFIDEILEFI